MIPVSAPGNHCHWIPRAPILLKMIESHFSRFHGRGRVDRTHCRTERLAILVRNEARTVADVVYDTELDIDLRKHRNGSLGKTGESVAAQDQDVADAAGLEIIQDLQPEAGALGFF